ncbi:SapC family protein [Pseudoalteromonas shioyasakiensis]|uniref:SapC family protein n=1 Tax=Pseudoalteromonas shioyasakiensis TaxID=1190813 RepID=UPI002117E930|nr:SapC family protein [Pseudoalteromonas shioyasakiensis]MCQ8876561.1 SapC family protein [Pseudoalteromonas shioyasakiensis]
MMTNATLLDKKTHANLYINNAPSAEFGDNINYIPIVADELKQLVLDYPVYFMKNPQTGQFELFVLTGFTAGENLFLQQGRWRAQYIPLHIKRQPFKLGLRDNSLTEATDNDLAVLIDQEHPRVNSDTGERIFDQQGEPTAYLNAVCEQLMTLMHGNKRTSAFITTLLEHELLEAVQLSLTQHGEKQTYNGLYAINEQALAQLDIQALKSLHEMRYLQACYMIIASTGHIQKLLNWKSEL